MSKLNEIAAGLSALAVSIGTNVVTGTKNVIETVAGGDVLPAVQSSAESMASDIPSPDNINTVFNLITQITILIVTLWKAIKKDKRKTP